MEGRRESRGRRRKGVVGDEETLLSDRHDTLFFAIKPKTNLCHIYHLFHRKE